MITRSLLMLLLALPATAASALATPAPQAFTATYEVERKGSVIGQSTLELVDDGNNQWTYSSRMRGTAGLAALLGANVDETSRFRWHAGHAEALAYDYRLEAAIKRKSRHVQVDWAAKTVHVDDGDKGTFDYAAQPAMVERHLLPLALGHALAAGQRSITLPVAVQDRVQSQSFKVTGKDSVEVPAGTFKAVRVDRTDDDKGFSAWYVPARFPIPVKLAQSDGGDIVLRLVSYSAR